MKRIIALILSGLVLSAFGIVSITQAHSTQVNSRGRANIELANLKAKTNAGLRLKAKLAERDEEDNLNDDREDRMQKRDPHIVRGTVSGVVKNDTGGIIYLQRGFNKRIQACFDLQSKFKIAASANPQDLTTMEFVRGDFAARKCDRLFAQSVDGAAVSGAEPKHFPRGAIVVNNNSTVLAMVDANGGHAATLADFAPGDRVLALVKKSMAEDSASEKFTGLVVVEVK